MSTEDTTNTTPTAEPAAPAAGAPAGSPLPAQPRGGKPRPRTTPIVWGSLILVFCAYVAVRAAGGAIDPAAWIITTILGLGALLLVVGIAVLARSQRER